MKRKISSVASRCLGAVLAAFLAAAGSVTALPASAADYGRLVLDSEVARAFDEGRQFEGHTYYYSGMINRPDGTIGIAGPYTLRTTLWKEIDPERQNFRELVGQMKLEGGGTGKFVHGMWILDSGGGKVGVWFSELDRTTVRMHGTVEVEIATPGRILDLCPDAGHNVIWGR